VRSIIRLAAILAASLVFAPLSQTQSPGTVLVAYVQMTVERGDLASASALVDEFRKQAGDTPQALEALSWIARGELNAGRLEEASKRAEEVKRLCETGLANRKFDDEPHLPLALGASYEVQAQALNEGHRRTEAVRLLQSAERKWRGTSIVARLRKNVNVLTLEGKPLPVLRESEWMGAKPVPENALREKVVLLFFWAHWCADCKAEAPILKQLGTEFERKGLVIIGPTKLYGYTPQDEHANAAEERAFIEKVYTRFYSEIPNLHVPVGEMNFDRFGASTTPTIVLADRRGIVKLYHPGLMDEASLRAALEPLIKGDNSVRAALPGKR
jgi:thiol-disulfide isomerase/thioredoxin